MVALYLFIQSSSTYPVKISQSRIKQNFLAAHQQDAITDVLRT